MAMPSIPLILRLLEIEVRSISERKQKLTHFQSIKDTKVLVRFIPAWRKLSLSLESQIRLELEQCLEILSNLKIKTKNMMILIWKVEFQAFKGVITREQHQWMCLKLGHFISKNQVWIQTKYSKLKLKNQR